ncbi:MAG TPA: sigma-70 family RNA polymerase sigma factor [Thermoanaerobaculia bacterium]|nr:sigma-70 family RNA polymerase sigma factor [Thermoanaerobaculia bacterium]
MPETGSITTQNGSAATVTDGALLRLVADRRPEALTALYDRHAPHLLALARRILGTAGEAEDVVQEVFVHVWNSSSRYDPSRSSVSTWLVLITRSRAIDRLRHRQVVDRSHEAAHRDVPPEEHASPDGVEAVLTRERRERVRRELENLPPEQRQVLEMAFYDGLSQTEIAERADLPLGTVKTRTLLAMKKLRSALRTEIRQLL